MSWNNIVDSRADGDMLYCDECDEYHSKEFLQQEALKNSGDDDDGDEDK